MPLKSGGSLDWWWQQFVDQTTPGVSGYAARRAMEALWPLQLLEVVEVVARLLAAGLG